MAYLFRSKSLYVLTQEHVSFKRVTEKNVEMEVYTEIPPTESQQDLSEEDSLLVPVSTDKFLNRGIGFKTLKLNTRTFSGETHVCKPIKLELEDKYLVICSQSVWNILSPKQVYAICSQLGKFGVNKIAEKILEKVSQSNLDIKSTSVIFCEL